MPEPGSVSKLTMKSGSPELARPSGLVKAGNLSRLASSISTSWKGLQSPVTAAAPARAPESTGPSNSLIGRSSMDITSCRSR